MAQSTASRTIHYYWREVKKQWKLALPLVIVTPLAVLFNNYLSSYIISQIINKLTGEAISPDQLWSEFGPFVIAFIAVMILGELVLWRLVIFFIWKLSTNIVYKLNRQSFTVLSEQSMHFHNNRFGGSLVSQVNKFSGAYDRMADTIVFNVIPLLSSFGFIFIILGPQLPIFTLILAILAAMFMLLAWFSFRGIRKLNEAQASAENKLSGQLADSITNIVAVKSNGRETYEKQRYRKANRVVWAASIAFMRAVMKRDIGFGAIIVAMCSLFVVTLVFGNAWFGAPIGTLVLAIMYSLQLLGQLWNFNGILRNINRGLGDALEMTKMLDEPRIVNDVENASSLKVGKGEVKFHDITFWHTDAREDDRVFKNFNLEIPGGQRIGLVGKSGSGKTTLTKLLLRFADVQQGEITIDGQNIAKVSQESLRHNIAYVPQEPMLFHRSLRENIAYGKIGASDDEIIKAAKLANAWEFIQKLPDGLDTLCGERGVKLSGGQRQRVAIARAILKDAPLLVLDEATSALDSESEKLIQDALARLMKGRTSIVVAHRLSTVAKLDRIIVLADGVVVEDDTHANLVANDGEYAKLWYRQTDALAE